MLRAESTYISALAVQLCSTLVYWKMVESFLRARIHKQHTVVATHKACIQLFHVQ